MFLAKSSHFGGVSGQTGDKQTTIALIYIDDYFQVKYDFLAESSHFGGKTGQTGDKQTTIALIYIDLRRR